MQTNNAGILCSSSYRVAGGQSYLKRLLWWRLFGSEAQRQNLQGGSGELRIVLDCAQECQWYGDRSRALFFVWASFVCQRGSGPMGVWEVERAGASLLWPLFGWLVMAGDGWRDSLGVALRSPLRTLFVCVAIKTKKRGCAKPITVHSQPDARTMVQFRVSLLPPAVRRGERSRQTIGLVLGVARWGRASWGPLPPTSTQIASGLGS